MSGNIDILKELENLDNKEMLSENKNDEEKNIVMAEKEAEEIEKNIVFKYQTYIKKEKKEENKKGFNVVNTVIFASKYLATTAMIFLVLLVTTNYSAYMNIAKSVIFKQQAEQTTKSILNSAEAAKIKSKIVEEETNNEDEVVEATTIEKYKKDLDEKNVDLDIEITPFTNRIVIPKIGKNIPLLDVKNKKISGENELNDIFMKELEEGIIRYPGSAKPGNEGNSFIFGHSSNLPWMKGDYNEVFANLNAVSYGDEVFAYYGQEKFTYKITQKKVIRPGDVSVLKQKEGNKQITLMTCWPIGSTLNRLVVIGELVEEEYK